MPLANVDVAVVDEAMIYPTVGLDVAPTVVAEVQYVSQLFTPPEREAPPPVPGTIQPPAVDVAKHGEIMPPT